MTPTQTLFALALLVACASRTVTQEEVFREVKEFCVRHSKDTSKPLPVRKFCYLFTCQYCFSHWVSAALLAFTGWHYVFSDFRGVVVAWFSLVAIANLYMALYERITVSTKEARTRIQQGVAR